VQTLDAMIARLRLMLADIAAKEATCEGLRQQYREQRNKVVGYTLYSETTLETSLGLLGDIAERLRDTELMLEHLGMIRRKAESELESLQLTKRVEQARAELARLQQRQSSDTDTQPDAESEIRRLQNLINEASDLAARTIEKR
jgi:C4-dicarboxylate-specific signal transduction histidine kinase